MNQTAIETGIRTGQSRQTAADSAAKELAAAIRQEQTELVLAFGSSRYERDTLAAALRESFAGSLVVGCTTAGEIGPAGYCEHSLSGISFASGSFHAVAGQFAVSEQYSPAEVRSLIGRLQLRLAVAAPHACSANTFAILLVDGLCCREESVVRTVQDTLGAIPVVGGSAGDDCQFASTWVFHDGEFRTGCGVVIMVTTTLPFTAFKTQHFRSRSERVVVTAADPEHRVVHELNGLPAVEEYARIIGVTAAELATAHFAAFPVVVVIDGADYVRSIQRAGADGSLKFMSAIEEGLVLRIAEGCDMAENLARKITEVEAALGPLACVLAFDCVLRRLEMVQRDITVPIEDILRDCNSVGFSTYGEQFNGVHVNQTLAAIAIGAGPSRP